MDEEGYKLVLKKHRMFKGACTAVGKLDCKVLDKALFDKILALDFPSV